MIVTRIKDNLERIGQPYELLILRDISNNQVYSGNEVAYNLSKYSEYYLIGSLENIWQLYVQSYWFEFRKAYEALQLEYDPIGNYKMTEKGIDIRQDGDTNEEKSPLTDDSGHIISSETITQTTTAKYQNTSDVFVTTYDNQEPRLENYTTNYSGTHAIPPILGENTQTVTTDRQGITDAYKTKTSHDPTEVIWEDNVYHGDEIKTHNFERSGNIGVTTSQQMITSEIALRKQNILEMFVDNFVARYCYYGGGCVEVNIT